MEFGMSGSFADTLGKRVNVDFSTVETPWYLNPEARVNTILIHFLRLPTPREIGYRKTRAQRDGSSTRAMVRIGQGPIAHELQPMVMILAPANLAMVLAEVWDEALVSNEAWL
jgi:hypothetical protein